MKTRVTPEWRAAAPIASIALRLWRPLKITGVAWLCWLAPLFLAVALFRYAAAHAWISDFEATIYEPGRAVLAGRSPYPAATLGALVGHPTFVYPPLLLWIDVPVALMPLAVAQVVWRVGLGLAVLAALRILGVTDRRVLALGLLSLPAVYGTLMGNVSLLLLVGIALAWRYRDRKLAGGIAVGLLVGIKLLLWPLLVWLLITRRFRSAVVGAATGAAAVLFSWALIGFRGLPEYPHLVHLVSASTAGPRALSLSVLGGQLGLPTSGAHLLQLACGGLVLALAALVAERRDGDRRAFSLTVVAALVLSPVVWLHYFAFLLVPIALASPGWGAAWSIPWAFWLTIFASGSHEFVVSSSGQAVGRFGVAPSALKIAIVLLITGLAAAYAGLAPESVWRDVRRLSLAQRRTPVAAGRHPAALEQMNPDEGLVHT